jgi:L-alanine-DL-glutamate epimerase-like enolase superfamily enzyme
MQCAGLLIGEDPLRIDRLWQLMYRGYFYPAGREKLDALGALDLALWDIKGKALGVPVHTLIGGLARDYIQCYATGFPQKGGLRDTARACIQAGFGAFRTAVSGEKDNYKTFVARRMVDKTVEECRQIRDGVGRDGEWAIDYHTRLDLPDAVRLSQLLEPLDPLFCEDLIRSENPGVYRTLRQQVKVPIAVGEQFGDRWDINELVEQHLIDYSRVTLPNVGGITELLKIAALCETHYVGLIPHFTGPISVAALAHVCGTFSGPVWQEIGGAGSKPLPHIRAAYDFDRGRVRFNDRPGLGVDVSFDALRPAGEVTKHPDDYHIYKRPDGSLTNW